MALVVDVEAVRSWLTARHDKDERVARAAHGGDWEIVWDLLDEGQTGPARIGAPTVRDPDGGEWQAPDIAQQMTDADAEHVFRWQPKRVLREVAAKRRRLERHSIYIQAYVSEPDQPCCEYCSGEMPVSWPCSDIVDDAQAYADRDDFPAELRLQ